MNKILKIPAAAVAILLTGALVSCADPGTTPDGKPKTVTPGNPRGLTGKQPQQKEQQQKAPAVNRPVDVESVPWDGGFSTDQEIQEFRIVVDEVWRYCLVNSKGGMACFDSSDAP